jgi:hypothetical protein
MLLYLEQHVLRVIQNPFVGNPEDAKTQADHIRVTILIVMPGFISIVDSTVAFDRQICFTTEKICDVITDLMLPPEFAAQ